MIYVLAAGRTVGIVLLVIAAIVVALLLIPVVYKLDVDLDNMRGSLKVHWLFRLLRFRFRFEDELEIVLAILFISIDFLDEERRARRKEKQAKKAEKKNEEVVEKTTRQQVTGFAKFATNFLVNARDYQLIDEVLPLIQIFFFRVRPRDIHGRIKFGLKDPSRTGEIIGAVSAVPFIYMTDLIVTPDFESDEAYIEGDAHIYGHALMIHVLILTIGLFSRKNFRAFIGALRRYN